MERERVYVEGARVAGVGERGILFRHVLPNVAPTVIVQATLMFSTAIAVEAGLSFVGIGTQSPSVSWGIMLKDAQSEVDLDAFQAVPPGLAIFFAVLAINIVGDHLQSLVIGGRSGVGGTVLDPAPVTGRSERQPAIVGTGTSGVADAGAALVVDELSVRYATADGFVTAVDRARLTVAPGEVVALVGESGCGKSSLGLAIAGLLAPPAQLDASRLAISIDGVDTDLVGASAAARRRWRDLVGVVFQEPAASLNPVNTIGRQLTRAIRSRGASKDDARTRALELLRQVQIPDPAKTFDGYPHQISGGMAQRVMIALALAQDPAVLIADEPTTALDVTVQAEVLRILRTLCEDLGLAVILITHDLGVVADIADRTVVMYAGQIIEVGAAADVVGAPHHPYTAALAAAVPRNEAGFGIAEAVPGSVPAPGQWPTGCRFADRCPHVIERCTEGPVVVDDEDGGRAVACIRAGELTLAGIPVETGA
ncbi:MAG: ATP-binding cassette domain-containing protein [Acidimicrobiales bacterium]